MERFEYVSSLGEGAYGTVWLCKNRDTNQKVAMKRFKDAHVDPEVMRLALREIRLLKASQHKNVVQLLEAFRSKSGRVYIVMEYVERTLTQDLRKFNRGFPPLLVKMVTWQLLQAVSFLHKNRIIHRDLKPANILLTGDNVVKLCDFGFARTMHPQEVADYTTYVVTRWYRPPEVLVSDEYGPKVDVWAIGCLLSEMASGRPLFPGKTSADQLWLTLRTLGPLPPRQAALMAQDPAYAAVQVPGPSERTPLEQRYPQFTHELMHLLRGCLALDPDQRMTADEALAAPYFADVPQILSAMEASAAAKQEFWPMVEAAWRASLNAALMPRIPTAVLAPAPVGLPNGPLSSSSVIPGGNSQMGAMMPSAHTAPNHATVAIPTSSNAAGNTLSNSQPLHLSAMLSPNGVHTPGSAGSVASRMTAPMAPAVGALQRGGYQHLLSSEHCSLTRYSSTALSESTNLTVLSGSSLPPGMHRTIASDAATTLSDMLSHEHSQQHNAHNGGVIMPIGMHVRAVAARSSSSLNRRTPSEPDGTGATAQSSAHSLSHGPQPPQQPTLTTSTGAGSYSGTTNGGAARSRLSMVMPTISSSLQDGATSTRSAVTPGRSTASGQAATVSPGPMQAIPMLAACDVFVTDKEGNSGKAPADMPSNSLGPGALKSLGHGALIAAGDSISGDKDAPQPEALSSSHRSGEHSALPQQPSGKHTGSTSSKPGFFKGLGAKFERMFSTKDKPSKRPSSVGGAQGGGTSAGSSGRGTKHTGQGVLPAIADTHGEQPQQQPHTQGFTNNNMRGHAQGTGMVQPTSNPDTCAAAAAADVSVTMRSLSSRQLTPVDAGGPTSRAISSVERTPSRNWS